MIEKDACDLFGGRQAVYDSIRRSIRETRIRENFSPYEIAEHLHKTGSFQYTGQRGSNLILDIEEGRAPLTEFASLTILEALGIPIEEALPPLNLNNNDREYWRQRFENSPEGFVGDSKGPKSGLELFLRFQALKSLNDMEGQAA
jgi:hypothetical protein